MSKFTTSIKTNYTTGSTALKSTKEFITPYTTSTRKGIIDGSTRSTRKFSSRLVKK